MSSDYSPLFVDEACKTVRQLAGDILDHEGQLFGEDSMEAIHKARVSTNKLRVALKIFRPIAPRKLSKNLQSELKWFKDGLAPVRDGDVIQQRLGELGDPPYEGDYVGIQAITQAIGQERNFHLEALRELVKSERYGSLKDSLDSLRKKMRPRRKKKSAKDESSGEEQLDRNLAELMRPLQQDFEDLRRDLAEAFDPAVMHRMRIAAKKFRYSLDFFKDLKSDLYGPLSDSLHELHECTGTLHDLDVLAPKVESLAAHWHMTCSPEEKERLESGVEWVLFRLHVKRRELMREFYAIWANMASEEFRARSMAAAGAQHVLVGEPAETAAASD